MHLFQASRESRVFVLRCGLNDELTVLILPPSEAFVSRNDSMASTPPPPVHSRPSLFSPFLRLSRLRYTPYGYLAVLVLYNQRVRRYQDYFRHFRRILQSFRPGISRITHEFFRQFFFELNCKYICINASCAVGCGYARHCAHTPSPLRLLRRCAHGTTPQYACASALCSRCSRSCSCEHTRAFSAI